MYVAAADKLTEPIHYFQQLWLSQHEIMETRYGLFKCQTILVQQCHSQNFTASVHMCSGPVSVTTTPVLADNKYRLFLSSSQ